MKTFVLFLSCVLAGCAHAPHAKPPIASAAAPDPQWMPHPTSLPHNSLPLAHLACPWPWELKTRDGKEPRPSQRGDSTNRDGLGCRQPAKGTK